jgi:hypothetical protein
MVYAVAHGELVILPPPNNGRTIPGIHTQPNSEMVSSKVLLSATSPTTHSYRIKLHCQWIEFGPTGNLPKPVNDNVNKARGFNSEASDLNVT